jgi:hypothetical protein
MNDADRWVYLDGPVPRRVQRFLDALFELPPQTPEEKEAVADAFFEKLGELAARRREEQRAREAEAGEPSAAVSVPEAGATARSPLVEARPEEAALGPAAPPVPPAVVSGPEPAVARPPKHLVSTALALESPTAARTPSEALPFRPVLPGEVPAWQTVAKTTVLRVMGLDPGETAGLQNYAVANAMAVLPFIVSMEGVKFPKLTVEQYAWLLVELELWPERRAEIAARYKVESDAAWPALEEHWRRYLAERPAERMRGEEASRAYRARLWSQWR